MKQSRIFEINKLVFYILFKWGVALFLLLFTQLLFAWVNKSLFTVQSDEIFRIIIGNFRFVISATTTFLVPFLLLYSLPFPQVIHKITHRIGEWFYIIATSLLLAVNITDIPYFQWTLRRSSFDLFSYLSQSFNGGMGNLASNILVNFWYYVVGFVLIILFLIYLSKHVVLAENRIKEQPVKRKVWYYIRHTVILLCVVACSVIFMRGGLQYKPINIVDAGRYARSGNAALVINTPFSMYVTCGKTFSLQKLNYFSTEEELSSIFSPKSIPLYNPNQEEKHLNVILILLESFSEEYIGCINGGEESYTPFLDSLSAYCQIYKGLANGKRSIESLPALFIGIPPLMENDYITSPYAANKTISLPNIFKKHGYYTAFFHGAYNGSMNFDDFALSIGFDNYFGMNEFDGDKTKNYDGCWGIFDEPFLQFAYKKINTFKEPFFTTLYTISSHQPYTIPEEHKGKFKKGDLPVLETIHYSDYAVQQFFEKAQQEPWFENTLFIITADHTSHATKEFYKTSFGKYCVPMFFFHAGDSAFVSEKYFQHTDLTPSLIDYFNFNDTCYAFGKSVFQNKENFQVGYSGNYYQLLCNNYLLLFDGKDFEVFDIKQDSLCQNNINHKVLNNKEVNRYKKLCKAIIQQYNNRMIENRLSKD